MCLAALKKLGKNKLIHPNLCKKPYLRTKCQESNIEKDIEKNQFEIKNLSNPLSIRETVSKYYARNLFDDPSLIKNTRHVDFLDENLENVIFVKEMSMPAVGEHLITKCYVDLAISNSVDESFLL